MDRRRKNEREKKQERKTLNRLARGGGEGRERDSKCAIVFSVLFIKKQFQLDKRLFFFQIMGKQ